MGSQGDSSPELKPLKVDYYGEQWKKKACDEWMKKAKNHLEERFKTATKDWEEYTCDKYDYLDGYIALAIYGLPVKEETDGNNDEPKRKEYKKEEDNLIKRYPIYKRIAVAKIRRQMEKVAGRSSKKIKCNEVIVHVRFDDLIDGGKSDLVTVPVYRVLCADLETTKFVDWEGRIYDSWENYLKSNTLPAGMMCYYDGGFERDANNNDKFEQREIIFSETSACGFLSTAGRKVNNAVAVVASAAPVLAAGAAVASYFTPVGWVATAGYLGWAAWGLSLASTVCMGVGVAGAAYNIYDKTSHGVGCLSDVLYLASSLAPYLVNYGIAKYIRKTVESGRNLSTIAKVVINGLLIGLSATQISSFLVQLYNFATKPKLTAMDVILFSVSVKNAASTLIGFRFAGTLLAQARIEFQREELAREAERQRQEIERQENNVLNEQRQVLNGYKDQIQSEEGKNVFDNFVNAETTGRTRSQMIDQNNRIIHVMREMDPNAVFNTFGETNSEIHFSNGETTELMINNNIRLHPRTMAQLMTAERTVDGQTVLHKYCDATQRLDAEIKGFENDRTLTPVRRNENITASKDAFIANIERLTGVDRFYTEPQIQKLQRTVNDLVDEGDRNMFNNLSPAQAFRLNTVINNDIAGDQKRHVVAAAIALHRQVHPNNVEDIHRLANTIEIVKLSIRGSDLHGNVHRRPPGERAGYAQQLANPESEQFQDLARITQEGIVRCNAVAGNQELPLGEGVGPFYHVDKHVADEYRYFGPEEDGVQYEDLTYEQRVQYYKNHLVADLSNQITRERNEGVFDTQPGERQWTKGTTVYSQDGQHRNTTYSSALGEERTLNCYTSQPVDYEGNIGERKMNSVFSSAPRRRR